MPVRSKEADGEAAVTELRRRPPWIGTLHFGQPCAERSAQILRDKLGTHPG